MKRTIKDIAIFPFSAVLIAVLLGSCTKTNPVVKPVVTDTIAKTQVPPVTPTPVPPNVVINTE